MLKSTVEAIWRDAGAEDAAVAVFDYASETAWSYRGGRWFHAASTMKVPVLAALYDGDGTHWSVRDRLHVRNRFLSALDGEPFSVSAGRDGNGSVHGQRGKLMRLETLAHHMITTSSNLATNLLLDVVGAERVQALMQRLGIAGIDVVRGVEDERAHEAGINNRVTADGLVALFRAIHEATALAPEACEAMREILLQQAFTSGIPAGLPGDADLRAAHKTGEISTASHDAGIVYRPDAEPYVVAILTAWPAEGGSRRETVAAISRAVYDAVSAQGAEVAHD